MWGAVLPSTEILYAQSINIQGNSVSGFLNILSCIQLTGLISSLARQLHLNDEFFITMQVNEVKPDRSGFSPKGPSASAATVPVSQTGQTRLRASSHADQTHDLAARADGTGSTGAHRPSFPTAPGTDSAGSRPQTHSTPRKPNHTTPRLQRVSPSGARPAQAALRRRAAAAPAAGPLPSSAAVRVCIRGRGERPPKAPARRPTAGGPTPPPRSGLTAPSGRGSAARREKERSEGGWRPEKWGAWEGKEVDGCWSISGGRARRERCPPCPRRTRPQAGTWAAPLFLPGFASSPLPALTHGSQGLQVLQLVGSGLGRGGRAGNGGARGRRGGRRRGQPRRRRRLTAALGPHFGFGSAEGVHGAERAPRSRSAHGEGPAGPARGKGTGSGGEAKFQSSAGGVAEAPSRCRLWGGTKPFSIAAGRRTSQQGPPRRQTMARASPAALCRAVLCRAAPRRATRGAEGRSLPARRCGTVPLRAGGAGAGSGGGGARLSPRRGHSLGAAGSGGGGCSLFAAPCAAGEAALLCCWRGAGEGENTTHDGEVGHWCPRLPSVLRLPGDVPPAPRGKLEMMDGTFTKRLPGPPGITLRALGRVSRSPGVGARVGVTRLRQG